MENLNISEVVTNSFNKFLCENDVSDLHEGNIGYMTNERPVLIDYGGV